MQSDYLTSIVKQFQYYRLLIRNEGHSVVEAQNRPLAHYACHIGQIIFVAKMLTDNNWQTLSIARDKSHDYNKAKFEKEKGRRHFTDDAQYDIEE